MARLNKIHVISVIIFITGNVVTSNAITNGDASFITPGVSALLRNNPPIVDQITESQNEIRKLNSSQVKVATFTTELVVSLLGIAETMNSTVREDFQRITTDFLSETTSDPEGYEVVVKSCQISIQNVTKGRFDGIAYIPTRNLRAQQQQFWGGSSGSRMLETADTVDKSLLIGLVIVSEVSPYTSLDTFPIADIVLEGLKVDFKGFTKRLYAESNFFNGQENFMTTRTPTLAPTSTPTINNITNTTSPLLMSCVIIGGIGIMFIVFFFIIRNHYKHKNEVEEYMIETKEPQEVSNEIPSFSGAYSFADANNCKSIQGCFKSEESKTDESNTDSDGDGLAPLAAQLSNVVSEANTSIPTIKSAYAYSVTNAPTTSGTVISGMTNEQSIASTKKSSVVSITNNIPSFSTPKTKNSKKRSYFKIPFMRKLTSKTLLSKG